MPWPQLPGGYYLCLREGKAPCVCEYDTGHGVPHWRNAHDNRLDFDPRDEGWVVHHIYTIKRLLESAVVQPDPPKDINRCARCGWTLADNAKNGCVRGNCWFRPHEPLIESHYYDLERWKKETKQ